MKIITDKEELSKNNIATNLSAELIDDIHNDVRQNGIRQYIVIDDEPFDICGERCSVISKDKVVVTDHIEGLTKEKAKETIRKLNVQRQNNERN